MYINPRPVLSGMFEPDPEGAMVVVVTVVVVGSGVVVGASVVLGATVVSFIPICPNTIWNRQQIVAVNVITNLRFDMFTTFAAMMSTIRMLWKSPENSATGDRYFPKKKWELILTHNPFQQSCWKRRIFEWTLGPPFFSKCLVFFASGIL